MKKLTVLVAGGIGYLLGSRAGREPYEKLTQKTERLVHDPRVTRRVDQVKNVVGSRGDKVTDPDDADRSQDSPTDSDPRPNEDGAEVSAETRVAQP